MVRHSNDVSPEVKEAVKVTQRKIDRVLFTALICLCIIWGSVISIPSAYQTYMLASDTADWFSVNKFTVFDDDTQVQRLRIDRTVNTSEPLALTIIWTIKDAKTLDVLCERELFTVWEKSGIVESLVKNVVRTCDDTHTWVGREILIQGQFYVTLHYGIRKELTIMSNSFTYNGK